MKYFANMDSRQKSGWAMAFAGGLAAATGIGGLVALLLGSICTMCGCVTAVGTSKLPVPGGNLQPMNDMGKKLKYKLDRLMTKNQAPETATAINPIPQPGPAPVMAPPKMKPAPMPKPMPLLEHVRPSAAQLWKDVPAAAKGEFWIDGISVKYQAEDFKALYAEAAAKGMNSLNYSLAFRVQKQTFTTSKSIEIRNLAYQIRALVTCKTLGVVKYHIRTSSGLHHFDGILIRPDEVSRMCVAVIPVQKDSQYNVIAYTILVPGAQNEELQAVDLCTQQDAAMAEREKKTMHGIYTAAATVTRA